MNSSTGIPLRTWTFLKICSDTCGVEPAATWAPIGASTPALMLANHATIKPAAVRTNRFDNTFIGVLLRRVHCPRLPCPIRLGLMALHMALHYIWGARPPDLSRLAR